MMGTYAKAALCLLGALHLVSPSPKPTMSCGRCEHTTLAHKKSPQMNLTEQRKHSSFMWEGEVNFNLMDQKSTWINLVLEEVRLE